MVTKYDLFELIYKNPTPLIPRQLLEQLHKDKTFYQIIYYHLTQLKKEKLIIKTKNGFEPRTTQKNRQLYSIIRYCIQNNLNYNVLLNRDLVSFIAKNLHKKVITSTQASLNPRTLSTYITPLEQYGLLILLSKKPLTFTFFDNILMRNLFSYYNLHSRPKKEFLNYLPYIQKELALFKNLLRKNEQAYQALIPDLEISFVHHSLSLEGNPLTLPDTINILKKKIIPHSMDMEAVEEIKNYQQAILFMLKQSSLKKELTIPLILEYHSLAMHHRTEIAGIIRTVSVHIKGNPHFKTAPPEKITPELIELLKKHQTFSLKKHALKEILDFSAYFHNQFQYIHPFIDGNSRISRLLTFHLLHNFNIPVLDIPLGLLDTYLSNTKGHKQREDQHLSRNLQEIILFNLKKINQKLAS